MKSLHLHVCTYMQQLWEKDFREVFWSDKNFGLSGDQISWRNPPIIVEF